MLPGPPQKLPNLAQEGDLGAIMAHLGRNLLPTWPILRPSWAHLRQKSQPDRARKPVLVGNGKRKGTEADCFGLRWLGLPLALAFGFGLGLWLRFWPCLWLWLGSACFAARLLACLLYC